MTTMHQSVIDALVGSVLAPERAQTIADVLEPMVEPVTSTVMGVTAIDVAIALNQILFADLLDRAPTGRAYVEDVRACGGCVRFDHGAIRTVCLVGSDTGALPRGERAFRRILEPLGYEEAAIYPLPKLRMTGRAFRHRVLPDTIPQFFVSELHVEQFDEEFAGAAARVFGTSRDPLDAAAMEVLGRLSDGGTVDHDAAAGALQALVTAFGRQHDRPMLDDYSVLRRSSAEAAWISTEGNAFNHATDRVQDVAVLAAEQRAMGRPIKDTVEVSATGRVRQTAFRADGVERTFGVPSGPDIVMTVPGSFYEFISRDVDPATNRIDLSFDSANATGIFGMTRAA